MQLNLYQIFVDSNTKLLGLSSEYKLFFFIKIQIIKQLHIHYV